LTKAAIAREAGVHVSTLYRLPGISADLALIQKPVKRSTDKGQRSRSKRMASVIAENRGLRRELKLALQENFRLSRELERYDPNLGTTSVVNIADARSRKRRS
jgi:hypothetical protein